MNGIFAKVALTSLAVLLTATVGMTSMAMASNGKPFILSEGNVATNLNGNASFILKARVARRQDVTGTATDLKGNTSEVSAPRRVTRR